MEPGSYIDWPCLHNYKFKYQISTYKYAKLLSKLSDAISDIVLYFTRKCKEFRFITSRVLTSLYVYKSIVKLQLCSLFWQIEWCHSYVIHRELVSCYWWIVNDYLKVNALWNVYNMRSDYCIKRRYNFALHSTRRSELGFVS